MARFLHASAGNEVMRRLAKRSAEQAVEMEGREAGFARGGLQQDLGLIFSSQQVARPAQTAKRLVIDQCQRWMSQRHEDYCTTSPSNRELSKNFVISGFVFVTIRQVSFNIHPWLYVKFM